MRSSLPRRIEPPTSDIVPEQVRRAFVSVERPIKGCYVDNSFRRASSAPRLNAWSAALSASGPLRVRRLIDLAPKSSRRACCAASPALHCPAIDTFPTFNRVVIQIGLGGARFMRNQLGNPRDFGVNDKPRCPNCGEPMFLMRRSPAADYALQYERQKFTCPGCNQESERVVDAAGKPIAISGIQLAHN